MQNFCLPFFAFLLEHSLTSQVTFSRFRLSFLSDLFFSLKLFANIKSIAADLCQGPDRRVRSAAGYASAGQWFESRRGQFFFYAPVVQEQLFRPFSFEVRLAARVLKQLGPGFCF